MTTRTLLLATGATALLVTLASTPAGALIDPDHATRITVASPVGLPGKTLAPGNYVFEVVSSASTGQVVMVYTARGHQAQWLGITSLVRRDRAGSGPFVLSEAPRGEVPKILTWFPGGATTGHAFIY